MVSGERSSGKSQSELRIFLPVEAALRNASSRGGQHEEAGPEDGDGPEGGRGHRVVHGPQQPQHHENARLQDEESFTFSEGMNGEVFSTGALIRQSNSLATIAPRSLFSY